MIIANNSYLFPSPLFNFCFGQTKKDRFENLSDLDALAQALTDKECSLDQWLEWKNDIKAFISSHSDDLEQLDQFFTTMTDWGMARNPQKTMTLLVDIVSLDLLEKTISAKQEEEDKPFTTIFDLAIEQAKKCPIPVDTSLKGCFYSEWRRFRPIVIYFIPNLLNIFLGAFNFLDSRKKFTTLWEKHLLLDIVCKFFVLPYCLVQILQPILVVSAKVYAATVLIIAATGFLISSYERWLKPLPDEIVNCTNLDKQMERGEIDPKVGQAVDIERLIAALEVHDSVLLRGLSGEGKTALIHHFIQMKHKGKLPQQLQDLNMFEVDCGLMISSVSFGHAELITQTKEQIEEHEDKVLLFFDDFYQIATNKAAFLAFKKRFLEDRPRCKCVLAVTLKEWEELKKLDNDYSFRRRTYQLKISSSTDEQVRKVVTNYRLHFASDIPVTEEAIEAIVKLSATDGYLPEVGRVAKAEEIFKTAVGICRAAFNHHYGSLELDEKELNRSNRLIYNVKKIVAHQRKIDTDYYRLSHLFANAMQGRVNRKEKKIDPNHLEDLTIDAEKDVEEEVSPSLLALRQTISPNDQALYLWYCFYVRPALEKILREEMDKINPDISIQVDEALVKRVFDEISELEEESEEGEEKL